MNIYIPTLGRTEAQITLKSLPEDLLNKTFLVCNEEESATLNKVHPNLIICPENIKGIGEVRQYVIEKEKEATLLFLDDDLIFLKREPKSKTLKPIEKTNFRELYDWFIKKLNEGYPMAGLSARQGNHLSYPKKEILLSRIFTVYALNIEILKNFNVRFDEMELMEDFNVSLHLIRYGFKTISNTEFAHAQKNSNQKGGCSTYRNQETQSRAARLLAKKHYPFVKVVKKNSNSWESMEEREDVMIYWKKAFEKGKYK
jgi:hypothetical protein